MVSSVDRANGRLSALMGSRGNRIKNRQKWCHALVAADVGSWRSSSEPQIDSKSFHIKALQMRCLFIDDFAGGH